jgi:hypothetical protein
MLFDLVQEIDHQQCCEQRAVTGFYAAEQHNPGDDADGGEQGQEILPVGGEAREWTLLDPFDAISRMLSVAAARFCGHVRRWPDVWQMPKQLLQLGSVGRFA